jgi:hypothetical protein
MTHCPSCQRPVATARPTCLYCGKELPPEVLAEAKAPVSELLDELSAEPGEASTSARLLLVLDLRDASPDALAEALALPTYQAGLLAKRGGFHFHRALPPQRAEEERERLRAQGIGAVVVPETEARTPPVPVIGGERSTDALSLRSEKGPLVVRSGDLLLVVRGPITREYQPSFKRHRVNTARLDDGYRVHLHRLAEPRPLEIDVANFELGAAFAGSVRLEIDACLATVSEGVPQDDDFRRLPPALGPAEDEPRGPLSAVGSLRTRSRAGGLAKAGRGAARAPAAGPEPPAVLDNVLQFRFYSGWRAAVERRLRGLVD